MQPISHLKTRRRAEGGGGRPAGSQCVSVLEGKKWTWFSLSLSLRGSHAAKKHTLVPRHFCFWPAPVLFSKAMEKFSSCRSLRGKNRPAAQPAKLEKAAAYVRNSESGLPDFSWYKIPKRGGNMPNDHKICIPKWPQNISNGRKIDQMVIKYTKIFHCKTLLNFPKLGFSVWKQIIWQPCSECVCAFVSDVTSCLPVP
jgi:hypothetical protein